jgi:hypothetical protein
VQISEKFGIHNALARLMGKGRFGNDIDPVKLETGCYPDNDGRNKTSSGSKARLAAAESRGPIASWGIERYCSGRLTRHSENGPAGRCRIPPVKRCSDRSLNREPIARREAAAPRRVRAASWTCCLDSEAFAIRAPAGEHLPGDRRPRRATRSGAKIDDGAVLATWCLFASAAFAIGRPAASTCTSRETAASRAQRSGPSAQQAPARVAAAMTISPALAPPATNGTNLPRAIWLEVRAGATAAARAANPLARAAS